MKLFDIDKFGTLEYQTALCLFCAVVCRMRYHWYVGYGLKLYLWKSKAGIDY